MTGQQRRILAVDDSAMNHKIIGKTIGDNFALECAMSGKECLQRIESHPIPDLILLDVTMPEMDGYEVCKRLRQDSRLQHVPVLFLSGRCSVEEKLKGYEVGGDDYITKPFEAEELLIKIRKALDVRENVLRLSQRATTASRVAIKALKETSNIGICLAFLETCFEAQTLDSISRMLFEATKRLGWSTSLQIQDSDQTHTYFDDGVTRELEVALLSKLRGSGEVDFGNRLVLELNHVSLLVKNVPPIGSEEREAIKELAATLLKGVDSRMQALHYERNIEKQRDVLAKVISRTHKLLKATDENFHELMSTSATIIEDMTQELEATLQGLNLDEYQEQLLMQIGRRAVARIAERHKDIIQLDIAFGKMVDDLGRMQV